MIQFLFSGVFFVIGIFFFFGLAQVLLLLLVLLPFVVCKELRTIFGFWYKNIAFIENKWRGTFADITLEFIFGYFLYCSAY